MQALSIEVPPESPLIAKKVPVSVEAYFYFKRPKSHYDPSGELKPGAPSPELYAQDPDLDNMSKSLMDALGPWPKGSPGILWADDNVIQRQVTEKKWNNYSGTVLRIESSEEMILVPGAE